jgi:predicted RNA-binding Zn-ribbon protein involved in translation (DUF1610 family)
MSNLECIECGKSLEDKWDVTPLLVCPECYRLISDQRDYALSTVAALTPEPPERPTMLFCRTPSCETFPLDAKAVGQDTHDGHLTLRCPACGQQAIGICGEENARKQEGAKLWNKE